MAGANDIRAGRAFVEVYADKTKLARGLKSISADLKAFGAGISSLGRKFMLLGAGVVAPLLAATKHFMKVGDQLDKMALRTGLSTNALSELGFAAEQSGTDIEAVEKAVRKMQKTITDASTGEKTYVDALKMVGLSFADLQGMNPEDQFTAIADGMNAIQDPTKKAAAAVEIFGRAGTQLIPMLGDMRALRAEAVRLGLSIGPQQAKQAAELEDAWNRVKRSFGAVAVAIGSSLAPMMTGLSEKIKVGIGSIREWIGENKNLIITIFYAGVSAVAAGVGLFALGKAISFVGMMFSATLAITKAAVATFGFLQSAALLLANPFVLVGVAAAALGGYLLYASGAAGKAATFISQTFATLLSEVTETFGIIADSMAAGDFVSAAKVGWALVKLEWTKGVAFITGLWEGFKGFWDEATTGLALGMINAVANIRSIWAGLMNWMKNLWVKWETMLYSSPLYQKMVGKASEMMGGPSEKEVARTMKGMAAGGGKRLAANDAEAAKQKAQIEADRKAQADILGGDLLRRGGERDAKIKAAQDAVDAARAEWEGAKQEAVAKAAGGTKFDFAGAGAGLDLGAAGPKSSVRGTFSASAVAGLGAGSLQERIANATELSKKELQEIKRATKRFVDALQAAP